MLQQEQEDKSKKNKRPRTITKNKDLKLVLDIMRFLSFFYNHSLINLLRFLFFILISGPVVPFSDRS